MRIIIAGPSCPKCLATERNVIEACKQLNINPSIEKVSDVKEMIKLGIMITPTIMIDGKVVSAGKVPTVEEIKKFISGKQ
ncbi:MAG: thioredoxin family protein [Brevinematia bacterium]